MAKIGKNLDRDFFIALLRPFVDAGTQSLPKEVVDALGKRIERTDWHSFLFQLSKDDFDSGKTYVFLSRTKKNDQIPALAIQCKYANAIPFACLKLCLNVVKSERIRLLGLRFETAEVVDQDEIGSHSFAHMQLTGANDLSHNLSDGDVECHDSMFASFPAIWVPARTPGELLLSALISIYGIDEFLKFINFTDHTELRATVLVKLKELMPPYIVERLPAF